MLPFLGWYRSGHRYRAFGAGNEARTRDLNLGKVALYQLSYSRIELKIITENQALIFSTVVGIPILWLVTGPIAFDPIHCEKMEARSGVEPD